MMNIFKMHDDIHVHVYVLMRREKAVFAGNSTSQISNAHVRENIH